MTVEGRRAAPVISSVWRPAAPTVLALQLAAIALACGAQALVDTRPWLSLAGFAVAAGCALVAGWREPSHSQREDHEVQEVTPRLFWWLFSAGAALCLAAGVAVRLAAAPGTTHRTWYGGLALLAASALSAGWRRSVTWRPPKRAVAAVVVLLVVCGSLFFWDLTRIPPEVHGDDAEVGIDATHLLEETPLNLFRTGWFQLPIFHAVPTAIGLELLGVNLLGLRAVSAVLGTATVGLLFVLGTRLWGFEVGLLSALFLASSRFFIHLSRAGYHYVDTPFLSVLVLLLFVSAWRHLRIGAAVWCGIALGLGLQTYYASRLVAPLLLVTWLLWLWGSEPRYRQRRMVLLGVVVLAALLTTAPMIAYFSSNWNELWMRTRDTSMFSAGGWEHMSHGYNTKSFFTILVQQLEKALTLFNATADTSLQYGYRRPLLEPLSAALFVVGMAGLCGHLRQRRAQLVVLWVLVPLIAGAAFTIDAPFYPRISGILPFVALAIGLAVYRLTEAVRQVVQGRNGRAIAGALAAACVLIVLANNVRSYFISYAPNHRHGPAVEIAQWILAHGAGKTTYMLGGMPNYSIRHGAIRFQTYGYNTRDIANLDEFLQQQRLDPATSVFVILPNGKDLIPRLEAAVGPLVVQSHERPPRGALLFYSAVPAAATTAVGTSGAADASRPTPTSRRFAGETRGTVEVPRGVYLALAALVVAGMVAAGIIVYRRRWAHRRRLPSARVQRWREHAAVASRFLFGPHERERWLQPPPAVAWAILALITLLAAALRLYRLDTLPAGFYCDEAGLGYNVYSLLQTGRDETGSFLPLYVWSFDTNYKNPVWIYTAMLPLQVLGLTEFAVRLTSALYGIGTVVALFFLGRALMGTTIGLLAALFLAVCPWHLHFSRIAFELIAFPFFFIIGVTCLVRYAQGKRRLIAAMVCFGYCLYTYAIAKAFIPLFLAGFVILYRRELWQRRGETLAALVALLLVAAPLVIFDLANRERAGHYFSDTTVLSIDAAPLVVAQRIVTQYAAFFSPEFLFRYGDYNLRHAVQDHGELYPFFAPLLLIGVVTLFLRRDRPLLLLAWWLATYPIAPALMREAPSASRGIIGVAALCCLTAIGAGAVLQLATQVTHRRLVSAGIQLATVAVGLALLIPQVRAYWRMYVDDYPLYSAKYFTGFQYGHRDVMAYFRAHRDEYDQMILTAHRSNQAHIFPLFYGPFPPTVFQQDGQPALRRDAKTQVGWIKDLPQYEQYTRLLMAVTEDELPQLNHYDVRSKIIAPDGTPAFVLVDIYPGRQFVRSWLVAGPYPETDDSAPPIDGGDGEIPPAPEGLAWRPYSNPEATAVDLNDFFEPDLDAACAWAINVVHSPRNRAVTVRAGFDDSGAVWINGEPVGLQVQPQPDAPLVDPQVARAHLRRGRNLVAVRSCEGQGNWFFYLYLTDGTGQPLHDVSWEQPNQ